MSLVEAKKAPKSAKKPKNQLLVLLDAHAIIHRAYHALPDFETRAGQPTGALYGMTTMLIRLIKDLKPDYLFACYDLPEPTFRHLAYDGYKAQRAKTDENLTAQLEKSKELCRALAIPVFSASGFEADDLLGTAVDYFAKQPIDIVIASGDMDTLQLVQGQKVRVYTLKKSLEDTVIYDEAAVMARFSFGPKLLPDYKGLRGDPSDNIVGVPGIGEKTATILINNFGTIEKIYSALRKNETDFKIAGLTPRLIEILKNNKEEALFSKTLATIRRDAPVDFSLPKISWREGLPASFELVDKIFQELEFKNLGVKLREALNGKSEDRTSSSLSSELEVLAEKKFSSETDGLSPGEQEIFSEAQIALWLLNSQKTEPSLADIYTETQKDDLLSAKEDLLAKLKEADLFELFDKLERPLIPIIKRASARGILLDQKHLKKMTDWASEEIKNLEKTIWRLSGGEFNINSPKQLGEVLFDKLALSVPGLKKTEGGARSTRFSELAKLEGVHPIIGHLIRYRELAKLLSTYLLALPPLIGKDGSLHTHLVQTGSTTGRFSSRDPNLQNIPVRGEIGKEIREAFVARDGFLLCSLDYSQIELRVAALLSVDEDLLSIFQKGEDVHSAVAARVFKVSLEEVTKEMRRQAKVINFGIIYGMGVNALRENLKTDRSVAQKFYDDYRLSFPKVFAYLTEVKSSAGKLGYTQTLFGRRRYFPDLRSRLPYVRAMAERMAINAPVQGTAADIIKLAIIEADLALKKAGLIDEAFLLLQVHDELLYEIKESAVKKAVPIIKEAMEGVLVKNLPKDFQANFRGPASQVPLVVSVGLGANWGELK